MAGISSFTEYLNKQPFYAKSLDMYFSRTEVQRGADPFNSELEAYVYAEQMKDEAKRAFYHLPENQKSAGEVKNDKLLGAMPYGIFEGSWTCFDNEGNMLANYHFSNGVLDGDYILYYKNGRVAELGSFKAGLKHGPSTKLYRNKKPLARLNYQNGIFDGPQRFFYANKKPYLTFSFADGKKNGLCTIAYDDGTVKMSGLFKDDYIFDVWEYNIKLEESFCSFLKDQEDYNIRSPNIALGAMKDCTASFEYTFRHELTKDCYNGLCVLPSLGGEVK